jgi:Multicopper oxidase
MMGLLVLPSGQYTVSNFQKAILVHNSSSFFFCNSGIPPGGNYTYAIPITQLGTYWIHSHYRGQYMDGLRAPLILHDPTPPYQYDEDITISLNDWYHAQSETGLATFLNVNNPTGAEPVPRTFPTLMTLLKFHLYSILFH